MDARQYQSLKDQAYLKIQERLNSTPSIQEELVKKFAEWFQSLCAMAKQQQAQQGMPPQQQGGQPEQQPPGPEGEPPPA